MTFEQWLYLQEEMFLEVYPPARWPGIYTLLEKAYQAGLEAGANAFGPQDYFDPERTERR